VPSAQNAPLDQSCLHQESDGTPREPSQHTSASSIALLPRASLIFGPFAGFTLSASYGKGVRSIDPGSVIQDAKTPFASVKSYEGGVGFTHQADALALSARSIFFVTYVDKDLIFDETAGRDVLGEGTTRAGWAGSVRATGQFFDESLSFTLVKSRFNDTHLPVPTVPGALLRSDTALFRDLPWALLGGHPRASIALGASFIGARPLELGARSAAVFTLDSAATLSVSHYELGLSVSNLLGTRYRLGEYNLVSDFHSDRTAPPSLAPARSFTAGAPRTVFGSITLRFGGA
jgi:outer membrane receptor protein involved in Fe transport